MFETLKKLAYGARVLLSRKGEAETIDVAGRPTLIFSGGQGAPFVYLHSTLGESNRWLPFYDRWAGRFSTYVPTHPGFHTSGGFEQIDTIEDMAFHYIELFDALGLEKVNLGGVSLGGWIAAEFACRWPERVSKLWISGAPGFWIDDQPLPDLFREMQNPENLRRLLFADPTGHMADLVLGGEQTEEKILTAYQCMTALARLIWDRPYSPKLGARLHRVKCPVLLLWGEQDRLVPPAYGRAYAAHLPQAEFRTIAGCGHLPMFEAENEFVETIRKFCLAPA